jgi:predicted transcriptional regulator
MSVKIHTFFDYATPFSAATNEREMAKIMRLKYPKACSNLEVGAEFFARMVEDVRKFEAWKVIGFSSFEEFCAQELGKTLHEVEEIVEGVKLLGGNPTEEEAKKASRSARAAELVRAGTHTQAAAARELGIDRAAVHRLLTKKKVTSEKVNTPKPPQSTIKLADPALTARNILAKMGEEYCHQLIAELQAELIA